MEKLEIIKNISFVVLFLIIIIGIVIFYFTVIKNNLKIKKIERKIIRIKEEFNLTTSENIKSERDAVHRRDFVKDSSSKAEILKIKKRHLEDEISRYNIFNKNLNIFK
jgi:hypothetical protein